MKASSAFETKQDTEKEKNLKGTFISVLLVGGFIVLSWAVVYLLFMNRL
ncbi:MAG TPA: cytochrome c oxidase subunit 2A [Bacillus sp. (in: firmicutes)]|nr:cytochrome c oxidase subunit 2A [Bacillus litorisediminis]HWO75134.1 cytochrome c oxidase subunit 2A [Bacillus sp. (in: firmicutes)]